MELNLKGKVAFITGAGQGIGKAIAMAFAKEGANIAINEIHKDTAKQTQNEILALGVRSEIFIADVSEYPSVQQMVVDIERTFGRIDILVNNAGISIPSPIHQMRIEDWSQVLGVNLDGVFYCSKAVFPLMIKQNYGRIISIASFAGKRGTLFGDNTSYSTSKSAVMGLTVSLAIEAARYGITVNAVAPGIVKTDLLKALPEERQRQLAEYPLLKRLATVEDVASVVTFLASDQASYITGEVIDVNGGLYLDL